jgi:hypothetical protein
VTSISAPVLLDLIVFLREHGVFIRKKEHGMISRKERTWTDQHKRKSMNKLAEKKEHGLINRKERAWIDQQKRKNMD